jgi:multidrug efflux pump subunit AcrA (membrane-fusion protein)
MFRSSPRLSLALVPVLILTLAAGCRGTTSEAKSSAGSAAAIPVAAAVAIERPLARFIKVTGTLTAEEQADVAAETQGRVIATPVERGT